MTQYLCLACSVETCLFLPLVLATSVPEDCLVADAFSSASSTVALWYALPLPEPCSPWAVGGEPLDHSRSTRPLMTRV